MDRQRLTYSDEGDRGALKRVQITEVSKIQTTPLHELSAQCVVCCVSPGFFLSTADVDSQRQRAPSPLSLSFTFSRPKDSLRKSKKKKKHKHKDKDVCKTHTSLPPPRTDTGRPVFLTRVLCPQRNGHDDDHSVVSSRVSSRVLSRRFVVLSHDRLSLTCLLSVPPSELQTQWWKPSVSLLQAGASGACSILSAVCCCENRI